MKKTQAENTIDIDVDEILKNNPNIKIEEIEKGRRDIEEFRTSKSDAKLNRKFYDLMPAFSNSVLKG